MLLHHQFHQKLNLPTLKYSIHYFDKSMYHMRLALTLFSVYARVEIGEESKRSLACLQYPERPILLCKNVISIPQ